MKFGLPIFIDIKTLDEHVEICRESGLSFIEIDMDIYQFNMDKIDSLFENINKVNDIYFNISLPVSYDFGSFESGLRGLYRDNLNAIIEKSEKNRVHSINYTINPGIGYSFFEDQVYLYDKHFKDFKENTLESLSKVIESCDSKGIDFLIKNNGFWYRNYMRKIINYLLGFKRVGLTWDIVNDAASDYKEKIFIMENLHRIKSLYISDYLNDHRNQPLFSGNIDLSSYFSIAKRINADVLIDVKTLNEFKNSLKLLRDKKII